jgi:hypothetical protein
VMRLLVRQGVLLGELRRIQGPSSPILGGTAAPTGGSEVEVLVKEEDPPPSGNEEKDEL